uniref:Reverse transcriptase domain-containing protein n=1 Tax=Nicotiana tabacum TaxID=4097 RepID=A0A1S3YDE6_TOBAC|nr:PREDICTED: uncharacterized protein LOC107774877 [Nicotiana tabacum]
MEWEFVEEMLHAKEFPQKYIKWVMNCITTVHYFIAINGGVYGNIKGERGLRKGDPISPLLFVICMKYFTRIMGVVAKHQGFGYHTKCRSLKLNHLCFADDVLLFSKGDFQSVHLLLRGLKTFSNTTGLCTNATKSNIFSVNVNPQSLNELIEMTGYKKGSLPFRYLGVPISAKRISKMDCKVLLDKMTVLKGITTICRNFLWDEKVITNKPHLVAWDIVCRDKKEAGLGITDCIKWNEIAIAKYVWNVAQKADNLWVKWINNIYLKDKAWWQYICPIDCCWYWKKICKIRDEFEPGFIQDGWQNINGQYTVRSEYKWRMGAKEA